MAYDDVMTRNESGELAVRTVSATEGTNPSSYDDVFTRDSNGKLAVRVVGGGGGDSHNKGYFATQAALEEAYPTGEAGDYAIVGSTDTVWLWDEDTSAWVDSDQKGQVTSVNGQTGAVTVSEVPSQTGYSGRVLGTDGFVAGWVVPEKVQRSTMPQASEEEVGNIYQFTGTTDANYTNGYFYKCVSDGGNPATYSWSQVSVQPAPDPLPSQTGNSGKFLTTDGTNASWSDKPLVNNTTSNGAIAILGSAGSAGAICLGLGSQANGVCVGSGSTASGTKSIVIGSNGIASANGAIQMVAGWGASGTNSNANTFKVANANGNYEIMSADGTIPADRLTHAINKYSTMPTAASTNEGWIVQYTGTTDSTYTHGYIYECKAQGTTPDETYAWEQVSLGGGNYLPLTGGTVTGNITVSQSTDWSNILTLGCGSDTTKYWNISSGTVGSGGSAFGRFNIQENKVNGARYDFDYDRFNVNKNNVVSIGGPSTKFKTIWASYITSGDNSHINDAISIPANLTGKMGVQVSSLPTAASTNEGEIYQYVGATDSTYTNGRFYKCVSDGQSTPTYSWEEVSMGGGSSLPSQTGNAGKFLTTDGTDASWSDSIPKINLDTSTRHSFIQTGNGNTWFSLFTYSGTTEVQPWGSIYFNGPNGTWVLGSNISGVARSYAFTPSELHSYGNCNLGSSGYKWLITYTTKINNGADITVPTTGGTMAVIGVNTTATLAVADWSSSTQTVTVSGVKADSVVFVSPAPASASDYASAGILCTAQAADSLTFTCTTTPTNAITVNVVCM